MLYIVIPIILWSSLGLFIRLSGLPLIILITYSCIISASLLGIPLAIRRRRKIIPSVRALMPLLILGPLSLINTLAFFYSYQNTSIANAVLTHYTAPLFVALLAPLLLGEKVTLRMAYAMVIATAGLWIMLDVSAAQFIRLVFSGDRNSMGIAAGLFSGLAYGLLIILLRILAQGFDPFVLVFFQNAIISVILFPFTGMTLPLISDIAVLAILGVVHSTIAPLLYFRGMSRVTAGTAAILGYIEPVCAIILGCLFLFEPVTFKTVIGGSMIIFSGFLIALQRNRTCRAKNINEEERV